MNKHLRCLLISAATFVGLGALAPVVLAGVGYYPIDDSIRESMIVSLTQNKGVIAPANTTNQSSLLGVAIAGQADFDVQQGQVAVQQEGTHEVLVTTVDGAITTGDVVGPSSINGTASKMVRDGWSIGVAQADFSAQSDGAVKSTIVDQQGISQDVYVGKIPVTIRIMQRMNPQQDLVASNALQQAVQTIVGKQVSLVAIIIAGLVILVGFIIGGTVAFTAVRQGIRGIARQPLSKQAVSRRMVQAVVFAILLMAAAVLVAFSILKL